MSAFDKSLHGRPVESDLPRLDRSAGSPNQSPRRPWYASLVLYLSFAGTGVGMSLPGSVLPALLARLGLSDNEAGFLFFVGWLGTSIGALLVRRSRLASIALAAALTSAGSFGLAYATHSAAATGWAWIVGNLCFAAMACYGVGLGMAMTAISLRQAAMHAANRAMELNHLNLIWAVGALAGPTLGAHSLRVASVRSIYSIIGLCFASVAVWVLLGEREVAAQSSQDRPSLRLWPLHRVFALWPLPVLLVIVLPTGIEASMGAWTAAYVQRSHQAVMTTVTAGTCFWFGVLLSRAVSSFLLRKPHLERRLLLACLLILVAGTALVLATSATAAVLPALFLVGFGLGPVYPLLLAIALGYSDATPIFFLAGLGSAILPWLTGIVSTQAQSLRVGLAVPFAAAVAMLGLNQWVEKVSRRRSDA